MALPTSFGPAVQRIYECLTDPSAGATRPLDAGSLFLKLAARRAPVDVAAQAIAQKRCLVVLRDLSPPPGPEMRPSNIIRWRGTIEIFRGYRAGNDLMSDEMERARILGSDDTSRVREVLCFPGNLTATIDGTETGIDGGALDTVGARTIGPNPESHGLVWIDQYPIVLSLLWSDT